MAKKTGFLELKRRNPVSEPVSRRTTHWHEYISILPERELSRQAARCMDCGTPFCQPGCPVNNLIPDWNDLAYQRNWRRAIEALHSTNNFPEFTGRVCPAPCEESCTLNLNDAPVGIKAIECAIIDRAWQEGWITPELPEHRTDRRIAIVGSGPAGLASAQQLARAGHEVVVFEKRERVGGLLRFGIPDFRLEKHHIDRRVAQLREEGVRFHTDCNIGIDREASSLLQDFDAVLLACGSEQPRDIDLPGRSLAGIYFAMEYLVQQNRRNTGTSFAPEQRISAEDKHVIVIGGGDTGSDCIGTANRQGAHTVTQLQYHDRPPERIDRLLSWPDWPNRLRTSHSHEEGCRWIWGYSTVEFIGSGGLVCSLRAQRLEWFETGGRLRNRPVSEDEIRLDADLVLLAMGYSHPLHGELIRKLSPDLDARGNVLADTSRYQTSIPGLFAAGDARRGQSLVVWAIREGRQAARAIDLSLMGHSDLAE